jgi:hypothetical protein
MQLLPQATRPDGHWHVPPTQFMPAGHLAPQAPQLRSSLCRFVQTPEQFIRPCWQVSWQVPAEHTMPCAQTWPHPPQLTGSRCVSTHSPLQKVSPARQLAWHTPDLQT